MATNNGIKDISFASIRKERFRIDCDDDRIIELNTSDLGVVTRLEECYPKLDELSKKVSEVADIDGEDEAEVNISLMGPKLKDIDNDIRDIIDYIFDGDIANKCAPFGNMFDPIDGECRYEHVIATLLPLYDAKLESEARKVRKKMNAHTSKYTK